MARSKDFRSLTLFFSKDTSLADWYENGILQRECLLYQKFCQQGWQVNFVTYGDDSDVQFSRLISPINILCNRWKLPHALYIKYIWSLFGIEISRSDLVKIHQIDGGDVALEAATRWKIPFYVRCGYLPSYTGPERVSVKRISPLELENLTALEKKLFENADCITVTTQAIRDYVINTHKIDSAKLNVIPNFVDIKLFSGQPSHKDGVISVCRFTKEKNLENLILACDRLSVPLILIGDGALDDELKKIVERIGANVTFRGRISNESLPEHLNGALIFALVSTYEGNPKALLEAMSCGIPVIGTNVKGINEIIEDGINGILVEPDVESIILGFRKILENPELSKKIGENARVTIEKFNSFDKVFDQEIKILNSFISIHVGRNSTYRRATSFFIRFYLTQIYPFLIKIKRKVVNKLHA